MRPRERQSRRPDRGRRRGLAAAVAGFLVSLAPRALPACAVCFGDPESNEAQAASMAVLFLLVVILFVLGGLATFFLYLIRRARLGGAAGPAGEAARQGKDHGLR